MTLDATRFEEIKSRVFDLREKVSKEWENLEKSLDIQRLCPEAFEHGRCCTSWITKDQKPVFQIKKGNGETVEFEFDVVTDAIKLDAAKGRGILPPVDHRLRQNLEVGTVNKALYDFVCKRKRENK